MMLICPFSRLNGNIPDETIAHRSVPRAPRDVAISYREPVMPCNEPLPWSRIEPVDNSWNLNMWVSIKWMVRNVAIQKLDTTLFFGNAVNAAMKPRLSALPVPVPCRPDQLVTITRDISIHDLGAMGVGDLQSSITWWRAELAQLLAELDAIAPGT